MEEPNIWVLVENGDDITEPVHFFIEEGDAEAYEDCENNRIRYFKNLRPKDYTVCSFKAHEDIIYEEVILVVLKHSLTTGCTEIAAVFGIDELEKCDGFMEGVSNSEDFVYSDHGVERFCFSDEPDPNPYTLEHSLNDRDKLTPFD